jgi:two-component system chemotaxis sensor kinase CheA
LDDFELEIKKDFLSEALMNLEEVEGCFMELESSAETKPLLDKIFRLAHNLKGGSRAVGFPDVAAFTHELESYVLKIQKGEIALSTPVTTLLLRSNDRLVEMLVKLKDDVAATFDNTELINEIQAMMNNPQAASSPVVEKQPEVIVQTTKEPEVVAESESVEASEEAVILPPIESFFSAEEIAALEAEIKPAAAVQEPVKPQAVPPVMAAVHKDPAPQVKESAAKTETKNNNNNDEVVRVNISRINTLNDLVGELIVLQSVVQQQALFGHKIKLQSSIRQAVKLSKDIQSLSMSLRMLPVKPLIQKLQRVVRDTATSLGKDVELTITGEQMEVDKSVLDRLGDPLIHILRNAADHGLEDPTGRANAGKTPKGNVHLSFVNEGNHLVIEIKDDGKGINSEVLRKKAIEKNLITDSDSLSEKQLVNLIFHPGFSTKTVTSEISGRGVGMDVVKTNIESIGGSVDVTTTVGSGSLFRLQIPLSLAVIDGLVVLSENNRYVIPLNQVQETVNLKSQNVFQDKTGIGYCFELRGTVVPLLSLEDALGEKKTVSDYKGTALIVSINEKLIALAVKDIVRSQQIVIKPLSNGIPPQNGWVGTCVLGDGLPTLILNPIELLRGKINFSFKEAFQGRAG